MVRFWLPKTPVTVKGAVYQALLISGIVVAFHLSACWYSVTARGSGLLLNNISLLLMGILLLGAVAGILTLMYDAVRQVLPFGKRPCPDWGIRAVFCGIIFVMVIMALAAEVKIQNTAFQAITVRSGPLVAAIKQYQAQRGIPPASLDELVPDYLPAIPGTGAGAYPKYEYVRNPDPAKYDGNPWVLYMTVEIRKYGSDALIFYPNQNYPTNQSGTPVKRFGDWACLSTVRPKESH
jgi:hypothetical protein